MQQDFFDVVIVGAGASGMDSSLEIIKIEFKNNNFRSRKNMRIMNITKKI